MQIISLFTFILVSTSLLSKSYYHTEAIGIDSASHGLLYGDRVVRRYGGLKSSEIYHLRFRDLQKRQEPKGKGDDGPKGKGDGGPKGKADDDAPPKAAPKAAPKENDDAPKVKEPKANPKENDDKPKEAPKEAAPKEAPKGKDDDKPKEAPKGNKAPKTPDIPKPDSNQQSDDDASSPPKGNDPSQTEDQGTPTVPTNSMSNGAIAGLVSIGGVFVLVGGLFAFNKRRKNKEMTKTILTTSSKAWEQQSSTSEKVEEETKPIGSYIVREAYMPTLSDELDIQPGDKVTILVEFDDGWVQGINETRGGIKGVFPRHCVDMNRNTFNKRSSSMGGGYTEVDLS